MRIDDSVYIRHMAVFGESQEVMAAEDIPADSSTKLIARGTKKSNRGVLDRPLRHKLLKLIYNTISVKDSVDRRTLTQCTTELMERDSESGALMRKVQDRDFPRRACAHGTAALEQPA